MFKKFVVAVPIVCFTASLAWADAGVKPVQEQSAPAPSATVEPVAPVAQSQFNIPSVAVTEPVSQWGQHRSYGTDWGDQLAYDSTGIDQTIRWVGAQGNHWTVRIDDVIAVQRIATTQDTAMASLSDEQINDRLGIMIGSWP